MGQFETLIVGAELSCQKADIVIVHRVAPESYLV
jgi:hypothetical protein